MIFYLEQVIKIRIAEKPGKVTEQTGNITKIQGLIGKLNDYLDIPYKKVRLFVVGKIINVE